MTPLSFALLLHGVGGQASMAEGTLNQVTSRKLLALMKVRCGATRQTGQPGGLAPGQTAPRLSCRQAGAADHRKQLRYGAHDPAARRCPGMPKPRLSTDR